ncbi:hypothetical protein G9H72_18305, partial [Motilibacter sp. K478]
MYARTTVRPARAAHHRPRLRLLGTSVAVALAALAVPAVPAVAAAPDPGVLVAGIPPEVTAPELGPPTLSDAYGDEAAGRPGTAACPFPAVLTGLVGTVSGYVRTVGVACRRVVVEDGRASLGGQFLAGTLVADVPGTGAGSVCPDGSLVVGFEARATTRIDELTLVCAPLHSDGTLGARTATRPLGVGEGPVREPVQCAPGSIATGIDGRSAAGLEFFRLVCRQLTFGDMEPSPADPGNLAWPLATDISTTGRATGYVDAPGQARWYRFAVRPDSTVTVRLPGPPANFDVTLFSDIGEAFEQMYADGTGSVDDLTRLSAEFAGDAFSPSVFSPSVFSPSVFSPSVFSPSVFSPSVFSPSVFSPSVFSPSVFFPSVFSPAVFSPSVFSPSFFSPSVFSPAVFAPSVFFPSVFSPSVFSPSVFTPSVFSPSVFSPSVFSPSVFFPSVFSPSVFSPSVF